MLQPFPIPTRAWFDIMDFVESLSISRGKTTFFVVVDRLTKYGHFKALHYSFIATSVALEYLQHVYKPHGVPESIVSDRDKVFLSHFWQELFKHLGTQLHLSTAYHP